MGRSRRNEEPLQSDGSLSPYHRESRPDNGPGRYGGGDSGRESGARGLTVPAPEYDSRCYPADPRSLSTVFGEQGSLATPLAIPQEGEMSENQSELNPQSRARKRKKSERAPTPRWLKICLCIIMTAMICVLMYMYDTAAFTTFVIVVAIFVFVVFFVQIFSLQTFLDDTQAFLSKIISRKRQRNDHPEEIGTRAKKNEDEGREVVASPDGSGHSPNRDSYRHPGRHRITTPVSDEKDSAHFAYSDSTHPEFAAGFIRSSGLIAWGASRRGRSHVKNNTPRQDSFGISAIHGGLVAIVADGVGSTESAEKASEAAVAACRGFDWRTPRSEEEWHNEIMMAIEFVHQSIISATKNLPYKGRSPSTTMTAAILTRSSKGYILDWFSVGDSAIMIIPLDPSGQIHPINRAPLVSGPTEALPYSSSRGLQGLQMERGYHIPIDFKSDILMLATDGCFKPMCQCPGPYIKNFSGIVQNAADASHLLSAIRQDGAGYDDDITAVLISSRGE